MHKHPTSTLSCSLKGSITLISWTGLKCQILSPSLPYGTRTSSLSHSEPPECPENWNYTSDSLSLCYWCSDVVFESPVKFGFFMLFEIDWTEPSKTGLLWSFISYNWSRLVFKKIGLLEKGQSFPMRGQDIHNKKYTNQDPLFAQIITVINLYIFWLIIC